MKKSIFLAGISLLFILFYACKKDKSDPPDGGGGGDFTPTDVQVILPAGSSVDLSKTKILSASQLTQVSADGKATIPTNSGTWSLVYLFDESKNVLMSGFISDESKEISIASTTQAMLYHGLGLTYAATSEKRIAGIKKIPGYAQFAGLKAKLEQLFVADPLMLSKTEYLETYVNTVNEITKVTAMDIIAKQIKVEDADQTKSGLTVRAQSGSDENVEVLNAYSRRGHAYFYKMGYKDDQYKKFTIYNEINNVTPPQEELVILGANTELEGSKLSGPKGLPLQSHELEAIWKVRVVGVGGNETQSSSLELTAQESAKLEEMWIEFFACDLLMPRLLDNIEIKQIQYNILPNNIELARAFINEVKSLVPNSILNMLKDGYYHEALSEFDKDVLSDPFKLNKLNSKLREAAKGIGNQQAQQAESIAEANAEWNEDAAEKSEEWRTGNKRKEAEKERRIDAISKLLGDIHAKSNTIEEWTIKSRDNDVTIKDRHSTTMTFTNHILNVSSNPDLGTGESVEYKWTTPGQYGYFKDGTQQSTTVTTASKTITYYSENAPNENNVEKVYVTAYIKGPGGTREFGDDTGTINVKKLKIEMKPNGATLSPKKGFKALTIKLLNTDGTNPIINGNFVHYKVEWSTAGTYGHLDGGAKNLTTSTNSITYTATDEEVKNGTENITATIYAQYTNGTPTEQGWFVREVVKGTMNINNDEKKIVYYSSLTSYHDDRNDAGGNLWHYTNCGVAIKPVTDALSYSVQITLPNTNPNTYSESWSASAPGWLRGYMYGIDPNTTGTIYVGYGATWGGCKDGDCDHYIAQCGGGQAKVTIMLK